MEYWFFLLCSGILGLIIGSFLNVVIYRLPREGTSIVRPRSQCTYCGLALCWFDNIPVLSYLLLRGKCRGCGATISLRYPLVEVLTGALFFFFTYFHLARDPYNQDLQAWFILLTHLYFVSALIALTFIDFEFRILPNEITISGIALGPILSAFFPGLHKELLFEHSLGNPHLAALATSVSGVILGAGIIYIIGFFGKLVFRKEAMGFGDVKLMGMIGGFIGPKYILLALLVACLTGSFFGLLTIAYQKVKGKGGESYIPFGPFLSLGALSCILFGQELWHFLFHTWPKLFLVRL